MSAQSPNKPAVLVPVSSGRKMAIRLGSMCLMLSIAMFGYALAVLQAPILTQMNGMGYFSLLTILASLPLAIFTPIGGKLSDLYGRRTIVIVGGLICLVAGISLGLVQSAVAFLFWRAVLAAGQGVFTAAPYVIASEINERKDIPREFGLLSSTIAVGGLAGSMISGFLADKGYLNIAIMYPVIFVLLGVLLIGFAMPNVRKAGKVVIDYAGMVGLAVVLSAFLFSLNYGPKLGWGNPWVLGGFAITAVALFTFVKIEQKASEPVIPMHLFGNTSYVILLLIGVLAYFYQTTMNSYVPLAAIKVMGQSTTVAGALQLPRTLIVILLPAFIGVWVSRNKNNIWIAMATVFVTIIICFAPLGFTSPAFPVMVYFVALAITGISEACRAATITVTAQSTLLPAELGIGTALCTFINSLAAPLAAGITGVLLDVNKASLNQGVNAIFWFTVGSAVLGLVLVGLVRSIIVKNVLLGFNPASTQRE